ncbi:retropepsin-like aspartic protease [Winogradskyella sp. SYSU M77433]|uniref:retropepsin-like aspartic protease n=1 Tax=Winogradskyella sp. SYSU M77433 TaxID=3042722 RepID=UPI0024808ACF|nr:retropepsin-like aspartic protease [Winogradskyella sp. SYSU M77433]MDH7914150.1 retropepsin-like aspartic protease [Winogradskyella sp. SYSU M77433]
MKKILCVLTICLTLVGFAQKKPSNINHGQISQKHYHDTIAYNMFKDKMLVPVIIEGKSYTFLFDTGAPFSVSKALYQEFKSSIIGAIDVHDASGNVAAINIISLPKLQLGNLIFEDTPGFLLQQNAEVYFQCMGIDGIIGSNMLRNSVLQIDDQKKHIIITDKAKNLEINTEFYSTMELSKTQSNPFIHIKLEKGKASASDRVLFDTGADDFYAMSRKAYQYFEEKTDVLDVLAKADGANSWGMHGFAEKDEQLILEVPLLTINTEVFKDVLVNTTTSNESRFGAKVLSFGKVTLDYNKQRFYFDPYDLVDIKAVVKPPFLVEPTMKDEQLVVGIVWDETLREQVKLGDHILKVNEFSYEDKNFCEFVLHQNDDIDDELVMTLKDVDSGEIKTVTVGRLK